MNNWVLSIICKNNVKSVLGKIEGILKDKDNIKSVKVVDETKDEIVVLVSNNEITDRDAKMWWDGYQAFLASQ